MMSQRAPNNKTLRGKTQAAKSLRRCRDRRSGGSLSKKLSIGHAFSQNVGTHLRLAAQAMFYRETRKLQVAVARRAGADAADAEQPRVKPQLGPCYTDYPSQLAAPAAIGLTLFLEFRARVDSTVKLLAREVRRSGELVLETVSPQAFKVLAGQVASAIEKRLLLQDLACESLPRVERYRLFAASQHTLRFEHLSEVIDAVILYGDVLPDWQNLHLHNMTRNMFRDMSGASKPYLEELARGQPAIPVRFAESWCRAVCTSLAKYLPRPEPKVPEQSRPAASGSAPRQGTGEMESRYSDQPDAPDTDYVPPLDEPRPPVLPSPPSEGVTPEKLLRSLLAYDEPISDGERDAGNEYGKTLASLAGAANKAGAQASKWEDIRSDIVERAMRTATFEPSPIEGQSTDGHEVQLQLDEDRQVFGEVFDRCAEPTDDLQAVEELLGRAAPLTSKLKRILYPTMEEITERQKLCAAGSLDPGRLPLAAFSDAVFLKHRHRQKPDRRGKAVLVVACDASSSLNRAQTQMVKTLAAGWLESTRRMNLDVLAGLYQSGRIRVGVSGPLVLWLAHPRKRAGSHREAIRAVAGLPDKGTGAQSDAVSIALFLDEARTISRGSSVYLVVVSDTKFNKCFSGSQRGADEVAAVLDEAHNEMGDKLHVTLVALGGSGDTGLENHVDQQLRISHDDLENPVAAAETIGSYVATCVAERERKLRQ